MFSSDHWNEIFSALRKNKVRTLLTAFGVFWGIFMLMVMLGAGRGLEHGVTDGMGNFATNSFFIWAQRTSIDYKGFPRGRYFNFNNDDIEALRANIPEIRYLAPKIQGWTRGDNTNNTIRKNKTGNFSIKGEYPEWQHVDPMEITGRFLNQLDLQEGRKVAVIGSRVREVLFDPGEEPIGQRIQIQGVYFTVIGVFKPLNTQINFGGEKEQTIYIPLTTLQKTYNYGQVVGWFSVTVKDGKSAAAIEEKTRLLLSSRHSISPDDQEAFGHFNLAEEFDQMQGLFNGISGLIWIVGIGTLLAGVIGISNIMLVIVRERTREIGIRRALGATPSQIMMQVISEAVFLTTLSGYIGLVTGIALIEGINKALIKFQVEANMFKHPEVDFNTAVSALTILIITGILAGLIPAKRAVSIKPVDALRGE